MGESKFFAPPVNPEKKDQASSQGVSDSTFSFHLMKKINQDKIRIQEISEMSSQDERIKSIQEFIDFITVDSEEKNEMRRITNISQQDEHNKLLIERLHVLKYGGIVDPIEVDHAWRYDQVKKILNNITGIEIQNDSENPRNNISIGGQFYDVFSLENYEEDSSELLGKDSVGDHVADYIRKIIVEKKNISSDDQLKLIYLSEFIHNIKVDRKIDLFLALEENSQKMNKETKDRIFESVEEIYFIEQIRKDIDKLLDNNKIGVVELVKIIEMFKYSCLRLEPEVVGDHIKEEVVEAMVTIQNKSDNYLIRKKLRTSLNYIVGEREKKNLDTRNDAILRSNYSNSPIMAEDLYNKVEFKRDSIYEKLSDNYAVIYDPLGQINCFFKTEPNIEQGEYKGKRKEGKFLSLTEILEQEEIPKQFIEKHSPEEVTRIYKSLLELPLRREIEKEFGIKIEDFSVREQLQFVMFLSSKSEDEVKRIQRFAKQGGDEDGKKNRIRSFLALESDPQLGEKIVDLGLDMTIDQGARDRIFSAYAELVSQSEKIADEILEICGEIFPEKIMDQNAIRAAILKRSNRIFSEASQAFLMANVDMAFNREGWMDNEKLGRNNAERLVNAAFGKQRKNLDDLVDDLKSELENQKNELKEFKKILDELNIIQDELLEGGSYVRSNNLEDLVVIRDEMNLMIKIAKEIKLSDKVVDQKSFRILIDEFFKYRKDSVIEEGSYLGYPDSFREDWSFSLMKTWDEFVKKAKNKDISSFLKYYYESSMDGDSSIWEKEKIYDAAKLRYEIELLKSDEESNGVGFDGIDRKVKIEKLEKLLKFQIRFEKRLENIIYGRESANLPSGFGKKLAKDIKEYQPELGQSEKQTYLPVGIMSRLPVEGEIYKKPIDSIAYLFWINNQGRKVEFMVVDTIQETNYQAFGLSSSEAMEKARMIGKRDRDWYQSVIKTFGLKNITLVNYEEIRNSNSFQEARSIIDKVAGSQSSGKSKILSNAVGKLVEDSVKARAVDGIQSENEKEEKLRLIRQYGINEVAFIMAIAGQKIGHEKEPRYDILARVFTIYNALKENRDKVSNSLNNGQNENKKSSSLVKSLGTDSALVELSLYLAYYKDYPESYYQSAELFSFEERLRNIKNQGNGNSESKDEIKKLKEKIANIKEKLSSKLKSKKENKKIELTEKNIARLGLLEKGRKAEHIIAKYKEIGKLIENQDWYQKVQLPEFVYPEGITGLSVNLLDEKSSGFLAQREFYSTHGGKSESELLLEANQVIASTEILAGAKILMLDQKMQNEYYEKVLRPLMVNFYIATSKNRKEAVTMFEKDKESIRTVSDVIKLIQEKIVRPIEEKIKSKNQ